MEKWQHEVIANALKRWEDLAGAGLIVTIVQGPTVAGKSIWTVDLMHAKTELKKVAPIQADSFEHCIQIAEQEAGKLLRAAEAFAGSCGFEACRRSALKK